MSHSMYRADRNTHIKIVVVGLLSAMVVVIVGFTAQVGNLTIASTNGRVEPDRIIVRGSPTAVTSNAENAIR